MIKADDYARQNAVFTDPIARIDAFAAALGYTFGEDGTYSAAKRVPRKAAKRAVPRKRAAVAAHRRASSNHLPITVYEKLATLGVGDTLDITAEVRANNVTLVSARRRIASWAYTQRANGRPGISFRVVREGWNTIVKRVA